MIGTLVHILQCSLASSNRAERGDIMRDFSVCVCPFLFLFPFLISILYVNVKKRVYGTSVAKVCITIYGHLFLC